MMMAIAVSLTILMLLVIVLDATRYIIPNWLCALVIALYPLMVLTSPDTVDWLSGIYFLLIAFAIGLALFHFNAMGGGDVKLLCALGLWLGLSQPGLAFLIYTSLLGGALTLLLLPGRKLAPWIWGKIKNPPAIPKILTMGEPVPYGIAIAIAFLLVLWKGQVPGLALG